MAKPPVTIGCSVVVSPGALGPPDSGVISMVTQPFVTANGMPLAVGGSLCNMINSVTGAPYLLQIGTTGCSSSLTIGGQGLVRIGDVIPSGSGLLFILGPPASPLFLDSGPP